MISKFAGDELLYTHVTVESMDPAIVKSKLQMLKRMGVIKGKISVVDYEPLNDKFFVGVI